MAIKTKALKLLAAAALTAAFICAAPDEKPRDPNPAAVREGAAGCPTKILLLGVDGADWAVMEPMVQRGELPTFRRLRERGSWGTLLSVNPMSSPLLWTTIVTGKEPRVHGITDYVVKVPGETEPRPIGSDSRKVKALWNIVSEYGETTAFLGWWASYPAERVRGYVVSDRYDAGDARAIYPAAGRDELSPFLTVAEEQLDALMTRFTPLKFNPAYEKGDATTDEYQRQALLAVLRYHLRRDLAMARAGRYLLARYKPDLAGIYLKGPDGVSHLFWKFYQPNPRGFNFHVTAEERATFGNVIPEYYRFADELCGELVAAAGDDYTVVVVSDHGFHAKPEEFNFILDPALEALGYLTTARGEPVWNRTKAYVFQPDWSGRRDIFLNIKGRDKGGVIEPAAAKAEQEKLARALAGIKTRSGKPLLAKVTPHKLATNRGGKEKPDIQVWLNDRVTRDDVFLVGGKEIPASRLLVPRGLSGDHRREGIYIFAGPGVRAAGNLNPAHLPQMAPTLLVLLGYPYGRDMQARPMWQIFEPAFLAKFKPNSVATYEGTPAPAPVAPVSRSDAEMRKMLKALGYIK